MKLLLSQVITYDLIADIGIKWQKFPSHPFHPPTFPIKLFLCSMMFRHTTQLWIHTTTTLGASSSNENEPAQNPNSMHKVDDKFHGHWPPSPHPTSLIIDKIQNCCRIFLFHSLFPFLSIKQLLLMLGKLVVMLCLLFQSGPPRIYVEKPFAILQARCWEKRDVEEGEKGSTKFECLPRNNDFF